MKKAWLLSLFVIFTLALLSDLVLTIVNLNRIGFQYEANPFIGGILGAILIKAMIWLFALWQYTTYENRKYNAQFNTVLFFLVASLAQFYGAYSHVPFLLAEHNAISMKETSQGFIIQTPQANLTIVTPTSEDNTQFYFKTIWYLAIYPMLIATITNLITQKSLKVKN